MITVITDKLYSIEMTPDDVSYILTVELTDDHDFYQIVAPIAALKDLRYQVVKHISGFYQEVSGEFDETNALTTVDCHL